MTSIKINSPLKFIAASVLTIALALAGCKDDFVPPAPPSGTTILEVITANADLNITLAALNKTNQAASLDNNNSGKFTVWAPTDSAFLVYFQTKLSKPAFTEDSVLQYIANMTTTSTVSISTLNSIITYSILQSYLPSDQIIGDGQVFSTLQGARLSISKAGSAVILNADQYTGINNPSGAKVKTPDLQASNGVVHTITRALLPVTQASVLSFIGMSVNYGTNPPTVNLPGANNYNIISNALKKTGLATTLVPNATPLPDYTIFIPNDANFVLAFTNYLNTIYGSTVTDEASAITFINSLNDTTTPTITQFTNDISYHIVAGRYVTSDLTDGESVSTLLDGSSFTVGVNTGTYTLSDGNSSTTNATISGKDNLTNAGIVQLIDQFMLPQ